MSRIGRIAMSTGLTRSSRPQVNSVGALILFSCAQYGTAVDAAAAAPMAAMALLLYIRRAISSVVGSVARAHRVAMSRLVTASSSDLLQSSQRSGASRVGLS